MKDFQPEINFFVDGLGCKVYTSWRNGEKESLLLALEGGGMSELFSHGSDENPANLRMVHFAMQVDDVKIAFKRVIAVGAARGESLLWKPKKNKAIL